MVIVFISNQKKKKENNLFTNLFNSTVYNIYCGIKVSLGRNFTSDFLSEWFFSFFQGNPPILTLNF